MSCRLLSPLRACRQVPLLWSCHLPGGEGTDHIVPMQNCAFLQMFNLLQDSWQKVIKVENKAAEYCGMKLVVDELVHKITDLLKDPRK